MGRTASLAACPAAFNAASLAFLDAYTRDAAAAWAFLEAGVVTAATNGHAVLTVE